MRAGAPIGAARQWNFWLANHLRHGLCSRVRVSLASSCSGPQTVRKTSENCSKQSNWANQSAGTFPQVRGAFQRFPATATNPSFRTASTSERTLFDRGRGAL